MEWSCSPSSRTPSSKPEGLRKHSIGEQCPHGLLIVMVDGTFIRNNFDSDFVQGGNGFRYRFCPRGELWVDDSTPEEEIPFVAFHECVETEDMRTGMDYETAHDRAKRRENKFRKIHKPGE